MKQESKSASDCAVKSAVDEMFGKKANDQVPHLVGAIKSQMDEILAVAGGQRNFLRILEGPFGEMRGYLNGILAVERQEMESGIMASQASVENTVNHAVKSAVDEMLEKKANGVVPRIVESIKSKMDEINSHLDYILNVEGEEAMITDLENSTPAKGR